MIDDMRKNQGGETWTTSEVESARDLLMYRVQMYPEWLRANIGL